MGGKLRLCAVTEESWHSIVPVLEKRQQDQSGSAGQFPPNLVYT